MKNSGYCRYSSDVQAGSHKWGKAGEVVKCHGCGRDVKLRRPPHGAIGWYVQVPRHKSFVCAPVGDK
jgi:hypothetical protein